MTSVVLLLLFLWCPVALLQRLKQTAATKTEKKNLSDEEMVVRVKGEINWGNSTWQQNPEKYRSIPQRRFWETSIIKI